MGLKEYHKKRKFNDTPEPEGQESKTGTNRFVIQRHQARRLHYDLRLEMDGVLKSWAVPKGPSMNPSDKRLAIQTEDHPVEYLTFHGIIPQGNYGAGQMDIWDEGTWETDGSSSNSLDSQLDKGNLKISFQGHKVKGKFALVKTDRGDAENQWLLIKKKDQHSVSGKYDAEKEEVIKPEAGPKIDPVDPEHFIKPMLATLSKKTFDDKNWIYEIKWDGYRMVSHVINNEVQLYSRNGKSFNSKYVLLRKELEKIEHDVVLDGEVVLIDSNGMPSFQKLQHYNEKSIGELRYYVFDLLYLNGHSTVNLPLTDRKSLIPDLIKGLKNIYYCDHITEKGIDFFQSSVEKGLEGVIAKKADSQYFPGARSDNWLKFKGVKSQEAIICGYTDPSKGAGFFGSMVLGVYDQGKLTYIGNVGTGFSQKEQKELLSKMKRHITDKKPFEEKIKLRGREITWLKPKLICEVNFTEWTKDGILRHPSFKGLRYDKEVDEIVPESKEEKKVGKATKDSHLNINGISVPVSNPDKVYWPESGIRKYDLIDYYLQVADTILPYLKDRPENLHRHPNGIDQKGFYQKDSSQLPEWIEKVSIHSDSGDKQIEYMLCQNEAALIYMANLGCIEINPWNNRKENLDSPDFVIVDIDPTDKNTFEEVIEVTQAVYEVLKKAKIPGYCKTSGSEGMHVYIPLKAKYSYDQARDFAKLICYYVHELVPEITSMERAVKSRKGKIYLDFLQNRRGQTIAAPYCVRPRKFATVSAPLKWEEVKHGLHYRDFTIQTMPQRIKEIGDLFKPVLGKGIDMGKALKRLSEIE